MKRSTIISVAILLWLSAPSVSAQFTSGSRFIGGGFSLSTPVSPELGSSINLSLQPEFGHFRSSNVASGFTATLGITSEKPSSTRTTGSYTLGIGPFIQRYLPVVPNFGFVLTARSGLSITYTSAKTTTGTTSAETSTTSLGLGLSGSPGLFYQINQRWLLQLDVGTYQALSVNYSNGKMTSSDVTTSTVNYAIGRTFALSSSAIRIRYFLR